MIYLFLILLAAHSTLGTSISGVKSSWISLYCTTSISFIVLVKFIHHIELGKFLPVKNPMPSLSIPYSSHLFIYLPPPPSSFHPLPQIGDCNLRSKPTAISGGGGKEERKGQLSHRGSAQTSPGARSTPPGGKPRTAVLPDVNINLFHFTNSLVFGVCDRFKGLYDEYVIF